MVIAPRGPDVELQRLRQSSRADDAPERTRALRELLRMDWRRARDAVMAALAEGAWADRALVLRALAGRADPLAKEALPHVEAAAAEAAPADGLAARALAEVAAVALRHDQSARARALCERALALAGEGGGLARARGSHVLGAVMMRERDARGALAVLRDAAAQYRALGEGGYEARALDSLGSAHAALFDLDEAERCYQRSLALKAEGGDRAGLAITLGGLGRLALQRGDLDAAGGYFERDLELSRELGDDEGMTVMANQLGEVWLRKALDARRAGDDGRAAEHLERARRHVEAGVEPGRRGGSLRDEAFTQMMQGRVALLEGRHDEADRTLARAAEGFAVAGEAAARHGVELLRAEAARARGDLAAARAHAESAVASFEAIGSLDGQVRGWMELALQFLRARDAGARRAAVGRAGDLAGALPRSSTTRALDAMRAAEEVAARLVARGLATGAQAEALVEEALTTGRSPGAVIQRRGLVDGEAYGAFLRDAMGVEEVAPARLAAPSAEALARLSHRAAERLRALPLAVVEGALVVAALDPLDVGARDQLALLAGCAVTLAYAPDEAPLVRAIRRAYGRWLDLDRTPDAAAALRRLLAHAAGSGASAVVLDPARDDVAVRMRVDGVLHEVDRVSAAFGAALAAAARAGVDATARVSTLAAVDGERVSLVLPEAKRTFTLAGAGFSDGAARSLARAAARREGVVLVAGSAGSGRSATLRALVALVDAGSRAVVSVAEELGPSTGGVTSVRASSEDLAATLGALSAQEVDVVAVDALRDGAAARAALRLAAGGRLVLAAVFDDGTSSPVTTLGRWGVPEALTAEAVVAAVAQRLVRRLCAGCRVPDRGRVDAAWLKALAPGEDLPARLQGATLYARSTVGCEACGGRGYAGRALVYGLWEGAGGDASPSLAAAAIDALAAGLTSRAELARVLP